MAKQVTEKLMNWTASWTLEALDWSATFFDESIRKIFRE